MVRLEALVALEYALIVAASAAAAISLHNLRDAIRDHMVARDRATDEPRKIVAGASLYQEGLRLSVEVLLLAAGIFAYILDPPPPAYTARAQVAVGLIAMTLIGILLVVSAAMTRIANKQLEARARSLSASRAARESFAGPFRRADDPPHLKED